MVERTGRVQDASHWRVIIRDDDMKMISSTFYYFYKYVY